MKKRTAFALIISHGIVGIAGFAAGIYALPILIAPPAPSYSEVTAVEAASSYSGMFRRDLKDSDTFHWGEGKVSISGDAISLMGKLAPGPDYKLYLSPEFIETEEAFSRLKDRMVRVGDVKTFENFVVPVPPSVDPSQYTTVVIWCESFSEFITATRYR